MAESEREPDEMKHDQVTELYERDIGSLEGQRLTRRRIHWMCSSVRGADVLDVGCSQGLASILLAREGRSVVGIDVQQTSIDFAVKRLSAEEPAVRERTKFMVAEAQEMPFADGSFDSVLLGEVLEHLIAPTPVLDEIRRVLRADGQLILTTPIGLFPSLDHKEPIYLQELFELFRGRFAPRSVQLLDKFVAAVAAPDAAWTTPGRELLAQALAVTEDRLRFQDDAVEALRNDMKLAAVKAQDARRGLEEKYRNAVRDGERARKDLEARIRELEGETEREEREPIADQVERLAAASEQRLSDIATAIETRLPKIEQDLQAGVAIADEWRERTRLLEQRLVERAPDAGLGGDREAPVAPPRRPAQVPAPPRRPPSRS